MKLPEQTTAISRSATITFGKLTFPVQVHAAVQSNTAAAESNTATESNVETESTTTTECSTAKETEPATNHGRYIYKYVAYDPRPLPTRAEDTIKADNFPLEPHLWTPKHLKATRFKVAIMRDKFRYSSGPLPLPLNPGSPPPYGPSEPLANIYQLIERLDNIKEREILHRMKIAPDQYWPAIHSLHLTMHLLHYMVLKFFPEVRFCYGTGSERSFAISHGNRKAYWKPLASFFPAASPNSEPFLVILNGIDGERKYAKEQGFLTSLAQMRGVGRVGVISCRANRRATLIRAKVDKIWLEQLQEAPRRRMKTRLIVKSSAPGWMMPNSDERARFWYNMWSFLEKCVRPWARNRMVGKVLVEGTD